MPEKKYRWKWIMVETTDEGLDVCGTLKPIHSHLDVVNDSLLWYSDIKKCIRDGLQNHRKSEYGFVNYMIIEQENIAVSPYQKPFPMSMLETDSDAVYPEIRSSSTYARRLKSFSIWPESLVQKKEDLAQNGFVYAGIGDFVKCEFCKVRLSNWLVTDSVTAEHRKHSPFCPFLDR